MNLPIRSVPLEIYGPARFPVTKPWTAGGVRRAPRVLHELRSTTGDSAGCAVVSVRTGQVCASFSSNSFHSNLSRAVDWCIERQSRFLDLSRQSVYDCAHCIRYAVPVNMKNFELIS